VFPWIGCGECAVCQAGRDNYCLQARFLGVTRPGGYASHVLVPHPRYLVDAEGLDDSFAATLGCSGITTYSAIRKLPEFTERDWVVVLGCGGLGLIALAILRALGIERVIACDIDDGKFAAARDAGARETVNPRDAQAALAQIQKISGGAVAGALDFVGMPATVNFGIATLAKGGRFILCGLFGGEVTLPLPPIAQRAIGFVGSYVGNLQELREVVELAKRGKLKPIPVETRPIAEANRTLEELKAGKIVGRVVLDVNETA
jgi:D-arabinose 1-dehydrogenase-like Zn-dependent alcohol dehydrogenase